jgi:hypothetical protein
MNPEVCKGASDLFDALAGYPEAQQKMLEMIGLPSKPGTLATTPVHLISSKADIKDIAATTPGKVAPENPTDQQGREIAGAIIDAEKNRHQGIAV